jgi:hypothetical protein
VVESVAQGFALSAHRIENVSLDQWASEGRSSQQINTMLKLAVQSGKKLAFAGLNQLAQVELVSALLQQTHSNHRVVQVGVHASLGNENQWLSLGSDEEDLIAASQLGADLVLIGNQATFDGNLIFETLYSAYSGILLTPGKNVQDALDFLKIKSDEHLVSKLDLLVMVKSNAKGQHFISDIVDVHLAQVLVANQQLQALPAWLNEVASLGFSVQGLA